MSALKSISTKWIVVIFLLFLFVGCQRADPTVIPTAVPSSNATAVPSSVPTTIITAVPTAVPPANPTVVPTTTQNPQAAEPVVEDETAVDPLLAAFPDTAQTNGDIVIITGQVMGADGNPLPDVAVEIWQTDANGRYDHPGDQTSSQRDMSFQFYGTSITDESGTYQFRTIIPGAYGNRPPHIHFKVKQNGNELLTSQFYFVEDINIVESEGLFTQAGEDGHMLLLQAEPGPTPNLSVAFKDIVVNNGINGALTLTPAQAEGPYYPVVDVANFDNDLVVLP